MTISIFKNKTARLLLLSFIIVGTLFAIEMMLPALPAQASTAYKVVKVVDGDTLDVVIKGKTERLRLIGINTPETAKCFGKNAFNKAKKLLNGKTVRLQNDPTQGERDKYGRLLRYVILPDGRSFNKLMISEGYAYEYTYNKYKPHKNQAGYKQAQKNASKNKRGLWADNTCKGKATSVAAKPKPTISASQPAVSVAAKPEPTISASQPAVKKSVNNICHEKGTRYYDQTKNFIEYNNIKECLASGGVLPKK